MDVELKPCPFCGGTARIDEGMRGYPCILCGTCGASSDYASTDDVSEAVTAWNTRHDHFPDAGKMGEDAGGVIGYVGLITPSQRGAPDDVTIVVHTKIRHLEGLGDKLLSGPVMICAIDAARAGERG